jgi:hypothetical protein
MPVSVGDVKIMKAGVPYAVAEDRPAVLALDGEREIVLHDGERATVELRLDGPWLVDAERTLIHAVKTGGFVEDSRLIL